MKLKPVLFTVLAAVAPLLVTTSQAWEPVQRLIILEPGPTGPTNAGGTVLADFWRPTDLDTNRFVLDLFGLPAGRYYLYYTCCSSEALDNIDAFTVAEGNNGTTHAVADRVSIWIDPYTLENCFITDSNGVVYLQGSFTNVSKMKLAKVKAARAVQGTALARSASGIAKINGVARRGRAQGTFQLQAANLPARTNLVVTITGSQNQTVRTTRRGQLRIRKGVRAVNLFAVTRVSIRDQADNELAFAEF